MKYKSLEQAAALIKAFSIVKSEQINPSDVDLETIGKDFFRAIVKLSYDEKLDRGILPNYMGNMPVEKMVGKWAFFPDIALGQSAEKAFGLIMGARSTKSVFGNRYFLLNQVQSSMMNISNSTPYIIDMEFDIKEEDRFTKDELDMCSNYLSMNCLFLKNEKPTKGFIKSFNSENINVMESDGTITSIPYSEREIYIIDLAEEEESLSFSLNIKSN